MNDISTYTWQIVVVAVILAACLLYMVLSVRRRFKDKSRRGACSGCSLSNACKKQSLKSNCEDTCMKL